MRLLAINCGSSSLKTAVIDTAGQHLLELRIERIGSPGVRVITDGTVTPFAADGTLTDAAEFAVHELDRRLSDSGGIAGVVHRIAHGGSRFVRPTLIDERVLVEIEAL